MSKPTYMQISMEEFEALNEAKPPASVLQVYFALAAHNFRGDGIVFPCISKIAGYCKKSTRTVFWALSWLRDHGFLIQSSPGSVERFRLTIRTGEFEKAQPLAQIRAIPCTDSCNPLHLDPKVQPLAQNQDPECDPLHSTVQPLALDRAIPCTDSCNPLHHKKQEETIDNSIKKPVFVSSRSEPPEPPSPNKIEQVKNKKLDLSLDESGSTPPDPKTPPKPVSPTTTKIPLSSIPAEVFAWVRLCSPLIGAGNMSVLRLKPPPPTTTPQHIRRLVKSEETQGVLISAIQKAEVACA